MLFGGDDDDQNGKEELSGPEAGDYSLPDDIGERIGEGADHDPTHLADQ